ncbi:MULTISPECIES: GntR family transcriptional regulator [Paenibacillus]|uniref:GntR family transcriptional regulator n=1 Tax=Paenibacillus campinasensis TaxID=66347 RepID=A0A268EQ29_9BACL|nr:MULTISPECIES: GntR family transcriptional regulator [Paenibacillus]MUG66862.1 substrate-binding domain-containing protein [Paenibacillus campinasensis]PAD75227.1 GntR family transcriptional regulator [Paenibacillus campinasensis]PAK55875.1 GntR family transcriptional regulator [Paenibacillus sp. 7541]
MKSLPLYKQIQEDIKRLIAIGKLREGDRVPSEKELSERYRVSQITSKNALVGLMEEGLLVRIQGKGTFVMSRPEEASALETLGEWTAGPSRSGRIGLVLPAMKTKVDQRFLDGLERYATEAGYEVMVRITRESQVEESRVIASFLKQGVDGMIIFPVENETYNDSILRLSLDRFPFVLIDRFLKEVKTYSVSSDNVNGTKEAVNYLLDQAHSSIAFISPEITNTVTDERAHGFEQAFLEHGLSIDKNLWCLLPLDAIASGQSVEIIRMFLTANRGITGAVTVNTELCRNTYKAALSASLRVPEDLELVTFDPPELPHIPYIRQNEEEMCRLTVELLIEQIKGGYDARRIVVPVRLVHDN